MITLARLRVRTADIVAATAALAYACVLLVGVGSALTTTAVNDLAQVAAPAFAGYASLRASGRSTDRAVRRGWAFLAASCWAWACGQVVWTWLEVVARDEPFPSLADVGYFGAVPLGLAAIRCFSLSSPRPGLRVRSSVEGMIIAGSLLFISWAFVLGPSWRVGEGDLFSLLLSLAYPFGNILTATLVLSVLARSGPRGKVPLAMVGMGMLVLASADSIFAVQVLSDDVFATGPADLCWVVGYLAIGLAALRRLEQEQAEDLLATRAAAPLPMARLLLPYLPLGAAAICALVLAVSPASRFDTTLVVTGLTLVALVFARQLLMLLENVTLTGRLEEKLAELEQREMEMRFQAFHDPLTGLANRQLFRDRVQHALDRRRRTLQQGAVLFLDLDDFKAVNDSSGHATGDLLLEAVARRLEVCTRPGDTVARLGGDEFGVLLEEVGDEDEAMAVAARLNAILLAPFAIEGLEVAVRGSIGAALMGPLDETAEQLLCDADVALYAAKDAGKGTSRIFEHSMRSAVVERLELIADLQSALDHGELAVYYQPVVDIRTQAITAVEALVRWRHPTRGLLAPATFIALAEETGLIAPLGRTVLESACQQVAQWQRSLGLPDLMAHVNLSARQLQRPEVVEEVAAALERSGLAAGHLVLEVTEGVLVRHGESGIDRLHTLKALGVGIAIDDFGTGYSSLSYLRLLPVDVVKIDKAFAAPEGRQDVDMVLLRAIVDLGQSLGVEMIAEGIERADQVEALREVGCNLAQGYWFAVPAEPREIETRLEMGRRTPMAEVR